VSSKYLSIVRLRKFLNLTAKRIIGGRFDAQDSRLEVMLGMALRLIFSHQVHGSSGFGSV
jgi:hypothetical protein